MIHFDYLTSAYVQTGAYRMQKYYRQGQHFLQRMTDVVGDGIENSVVGPVAGPAGVTTTLYTYTVDGLGGQLTVDYTITPSGTTTVATSTVDVYVGGVSQISHTIASGVSTAQVYSDVVNAATGSTITVVVVNNEPTVTLDASSISSSPVVNASGSAVAAVSATTTVYSYTATSNETLSVGYTLTPSAAPTVTSTVDVDVNAITKATHTLPISAAAQTLVDTVTVAVGDVVTISVVNADATETYTATAINIDVYGAAITTSRLDQLFPDFQLDWAFLSTGQDNLLGYDPGAYGIGLGASKQTIIVPLVKPVHLLYYYSERSTDEQRHLVQVDASGIDAAAYITDLVTPGIMGGTQTAPVRMVYTEVEFVDKWGYQGFNRFGDNIFPKGMQYSNVNELNSFTGSFTDINDVTGTYTAYFDPIYFRNSWPIFDYIYMTAGFRAHLDPQVTGISGWLLRYRGEFPSENMAPINRIGSATAVEGGYRYYWNGTTLVELSATGSSLLTDGGVTYSNADSYNVTGYTRH